jgi:hypothetical protein
MDLTKQCFCAEGSFCNDDKIITDENLNNHAIRDAEIILGRKLILRNDQQ